MADNEIFEYSYCAPEQAEIQKIRDKYLPKEMSKIDQLRSLDEKSTRRAAAVSIMHGVLFTLLLGVGMSCCMVWSAQWFLPGVLIGCIGIAGVAGAYPIYNRIVRKDRERIAPEILRLSNELILGSEN